MENPVHSNLEIEPDTRQMPENQIKRWYDFDDSVSQLVHLVEKLSPVSQKLFSRLLIQVCKQVVRAQKRKFSQNLNWTTYHGIIKSRRGRRWYDQEREVKIAFNLLFSMKDSDKVQIAKELTDTARVIAGYEAHCKICQNKIKAYMITSIIDTYVHEGPGKIIELYGVFLDK